MMDMIWCVWRECGRHERVCVEGSMMSMTGCVWREYDRHDRVCVDGV